MIVDPDHNQFRLRLLFWAGNYRGEQPFTSAPQKNLEEAIYLVRQIQANKALHTQVLSYVIQENQATTEVPRWHTLDYTDWCDL